MSDLAWTGTPVKPHAAAQQNGAETSPYGERRGRLPLRWPFATAVEGFRRKALANAAYDPASTFVWGQMMAVGVIEMLKSFEDRFGADGHDAARAALRRVGEKVMREMLVGVELPELPPAELASLCATWINEVVYASIEAPRVRGDRAEFEILYCPHEDVYGAFDCRVQRYFVEGMLEAARAVFAERGFDVRFTTTIPSGSATCRFEIYPKSEGGSAGGSDWNDYSERLRARALKMADGSVFGGATQS